MSSVKHASKVLMLLALFVLKPWYPTVLHLENKKKTVQWRRAALIAVAGAGAGAVAVLLTGGVLFPFLGLGAASTTASTATTAATAAGVIPAFTYVKLTTAALINLPQMTPAAFAALTYIPTGVLEAIPLAAAATSATAIQEYE